MSLAWDPPETTKQNGVINNYITCISHSDDGSCFQTFITYKREWFVTNLKESTKYYVRVLASTKVGNGMYSDFKEFITGKRQ